MINVLQRITALCCLWLATPAAAQWTPIQLLHKHDSTAQGMLGLLLVEGEGALGASSLDNALTEKLWRGGYIDQALKDRNLERMQARNRAGIQAQSELSFYDFKSPWFGGNELGWKVSAGTFYNAYATFEKELFRTVFYGNQTADGGANLGALNMESQWFQKISLGVFSKKTLSSISIGLVGGDAFNKLQVNNAYWKTTPQLDSLTVGYAGNYTEADPSKSGFGAGKGVGFAVDGNLNLPLPDNAGWVSLTLSNVGWVHWGAQTVRHTFDSTTVWTGISLNNVFALETDTLGLPNLQDSLHSTEANGARWAPLPGAVHLRYARQLNKRWWIDAGASIWPNNSATPLVHLGVSRNAGEAWLVRSQASIGGYNRWSVGAEVQCVTRSKWFFRLGSYAVQGWLSNRTAGYDGRITIGKYFFVHQTAATDAVEGD